MNNTSNKIEVQYLYCESLRYEKANIGKNLSNLCQFIGNKYGEIDDESRLIPYQNELKSNSGLPISFKIFLGVLLGGLKKEK